MFQIYMLQVIIQIIKFHVIEAIIGRSRLSPISRSSNLQAEPTFMKKKRYAELQVESLWTKEEMTKVQARVKIYEGQNIDQKVPLKTPTVTEIKAGDSRYYKEAELSGSKWKIKCSYSNTGWAKGNKLSTTNNQQLQLQNMQHHLQDQQSSITPNENEVKERNVKH